MELPSSQRPGASLAFGGLTWTFSWQVKNQVGQELAQGQKALPVGS